MKRLNKICFAVFGFSLAFSGLLNIAISSKKAEKAFAGEPLPYFRLGNHDLLDDHIANSEDGFKGEARLEITDEQYVLRLTNFDNNGGSYGDSDNNYGLYVKYLEKPLVIELAGTNVISNSNNSVDVGYGMYVSINSESSLSFVSADDENPGSLSITSSKGSNNSHGLRVIAGELTFNNCSITIQAAASKGNDGLVSNCDIVVEENAELFVMCGATSSSSSIACYADKNFRLDSGKVVLSGGDSNGISVGLSCYKKILVNNGSFYSRGGAANNTMGIMINDDITIKGGRFHAEGGDISINPGVSYGVGGSDSYVILIEKGCEYFCAKGFTQASQLKISSEFEGYGSATLSIESDLSRTKIPANENKPPYDYRTIVFQRIVFEISHDDVEYDGLKHPAMTLLVKNPTSGYTVKYQEYGSDVWVDECPQYRNVKEDGYSVKYKIEANLFTTVSGTIEFHITKAKSVLSVVPVKAKDFYVDGKDHPLLTAGETECGTLMYSVNGGGYSLDVPSAKEVGEYFISYKVVGDINHTDLEPQHLGSVVVSLAPEPTPDTDVTPTPTPTDSVDASKGLSGGAVALIVIGSVLVGVIGGFSFAWFGLAKKSFKAIGEGFKEMFKKNKQ